MADNINALVNTDEENGTQSAAWTDVNGISPDQKVLIGRIDSLSGNMVATWEPSSDAAVLIEKTVTVNGEYDATLDEADGYSSVTVSVAATLSDTDLVSSIAANGSYALWYYTVSPSVIHFTAAADVPAEGVTTLGTVTVAVE